MTDRPLTLRFSHPLPYGAIAQDGGVQFVVFSRRATAMRVLLYKRADDPEPAELIELDPELNRWGDIWSIFVPGVGPGQLYHFQADGPYDPDHGLRFDGRARLIDPYAKALAGNFLPAEGGIVRPPKCVVVSDEFDWHGDRHLRRSLDETVIYEVHVRGFTCAKSSGVSQPGTYLGLIEKIPYLQSLGVTAVELMPVFEFPLNDCLGQASERPNYWGYDPLAFFAPHRGYAVGGEPGGQVREFKEMVLALHRAGIEVILDVVLNHTAEGNENGPTLSFKGLENRVYYMLENGGGTYRNYSGCGNTLNGNHPIVREMIFHCLRHWVHNYHVDGFRFDLASILSRNRDGDLVPNPPVVESIGEDPLLADTKIIAEAWDAAGGYQVGAFGSHALGRMERPLPRRSPPLLAGRFEHAGPAGHAAGRLQRPVPGQRTQARTTASTSSPPTTASPSTTWCRTTRSTTKPTAKTTTTGRRTISATTTASRAPRAAWPSSRSACGKSRT